MCRCTEYLNLTIWYFRRVLNVKFLFFGLFAGVSLIFSDGVSDPILILSSGPDAGEQSKKKNGSLHSVFNLFGSRNIYVNTCTSKKMKKLDTRQASTLARRGPTRRLSVQWSDSPPWIRERDWHQDGQTDWLTDCHLQSDLILVSLQG
jgi:hypothetical protein